MLYTVELAIFLAVLLTSDLKIKNLLLGKPLGFNCNLVMVMVEDRAVYFVSCLLCRNIDQTMALERGVWLPDSSLDIRESYR